MSEELKMTPGMTLAFFASVIKSGEPWTGTCQKAYDEAMAALRASPTPPTTEGRLREIHTFLLGEGPLDGRWFGDEPPVVGRLRRPFWWRTNLRAALSPPDGDGKQEQATRAEDGSTAPTDR